MKFVHRLLYYLGGFGIGLILLFFFLGGKKTSCDYSPNARVLKNIRNKEKLYSNEALNSMKTHRIDTVAINTLLQNGDVDFSKSNTKLESCKLYWIEDEFDTKVLTIKVENCDSIAKIESIQMY